MDISCYRKGEGKIDTNLLDVYVLEVPSANLLGLYVLEVPICLMGLRTVTMVESLSLVSEGQGSSPGKACAV